MGVNTVRLHTTNNCDNVTSIGAMGQIISLFLLYKHVQYQNAQFITICINQFI